MKSTFRLLRFLALSGSALCLQACITTETTTTAPDGTTTTTRVTAPAPGYADAATVLAGEIIHEVIDEK